MAKYLATISSTLPAPQAFRFMADFTNTKLWDPSVREARADSAGPVELGAAFDLVTRFAGRDVPLRYTIVGYTPPSRVVLEATRPAFASRDTIEVEPAEHGSLVHYDALLAFSGLGRLLDPFMQQIFNRIGAHATAGLQTALNP